MCQVFKCKQDPAPLWSCLHLKKFLPCFNVSVILGQNQEFHHHAIFFDLL